MSPQYARRSVAALSVLAAAIAAEASETVGASINAKGVTEIFGNHFGMPGVNATYDYVVVGGGTAGNTIAARLALDPANYSVALIEAGTFYEILSSNRTQVPGYNFEAANPTNVGTLSSMTAVQIDTEPIAVSPPTDFHYPACLIGCANSSFHRATMVVRSGMSRA